MKERMQKTLSQVNGCPQRDRSETEWYGECRPLCGCVKTTSWKVKTKVANLIRCGINKYKAYEWGNTRKGYWRIADSPILKRAIDNNKLRSAGYATLMEAYLEWYPK